MMTDKRDENETTFADLIEAGACGWYTAPVTRRRCDGEDSLFAQFGACECTDCTGVT